MAELRSMHVDAMSREQGRLVKVLQVRAGKYPIVTLQTQRLNMIGNLV